jgi:UDP-glucuronate 4-epimerase
MYILITGVAGFVGFNFANELIKKKYKVIGIDNLNSYYSKKLKLERIKILSQNKNFRFLKIDLIYKNKIKKIFQKFKFSEVYNFAAQAGVGYSIKNPCAYIDTNVSGFANIISLSNEFGVKKFYYASSSSVYGNCQKYPIKEKQKLNPINIYGLSKKFNEEIARNFYDMYNFKSVGLRFFTVFGEWGRPDMFILKFLDSSFNSKKFVLNNNGKHFRDFTYIVDVVHILMKLRKLKITGPEIFNICSNKPVGLKKIINFYKDKIPYTKIILGKKQKLDMYKTHGDNKKIISKIKKFNFTETKISLKNTLDWFKKYHKLIA